LNAKIIDNNFEDLHFILSVETTTPDVAIGDINNLGINEIIGTGMSNFSGSPANRRKNIKNGASKLHGLLIKPDEEFSLIEALLPVNASTGYFPELVIKGNKTTPEYGGGLCQIGTTIFRTALASGLPILERQNHSYSVSYYLENGLPGVDATIYDPKPDLRFKNDTGNYILIQSRIIGDKLYFDFWGTKDGRTATQTKPKTWGVKSPLPTKITESPDLAPGQKKCTESAHKGITASFNYIVSYTDGHTATTTFTSVYKPWQEVCLIGASAGSSTPAAIDKQ
jgi:vancomycin resistance protein YoaR